MPPSYFTLAELCSSEIATRRGIDNTPSEAAKRALIDLIANVLNPVRSHFGKPVTISSGYRSPKLNKVVGGSVNSDHVLGRAADFTIPGESNLAICKWIAANLAFRQCIYEFGESGWVHISYAKGDNRKQRLSAKRVQVKSLIPGRRKLTTIYPTGFVA